MRGLLPSVWLLLATLYISSILALVRPFASDDDWPTPPTVNETVRAKEPLSFALNPEAAAQVEPIAFVTPVEPKVERRNEWAQIAGYTTVVRAEPTTASPVLFAYAVGRPLRVIAREGGFARVQDLGSGQFGWVKETSLVPFTGGYRQREDVIAEPQLVASTAPQAVPPSHMTAPNVDVPQAAVAKAVVAKKVPSQRNDAAAAAAARAKKEMVAVAEPGQRGFFGMRRDRPQRVALGANDTGVAGIIDRALRGR
jgi:hypothetical protein